MEQLAMSTAICAWCNDRIAGLTKLGELVREDDQNFHRGCVLRYKAQKVLDRQKETTPTGRRWKCPTGGHYHYDEAGGDTQI